MPHRHGAAPLILLAQTRQADRDKEHSERVDARHTKLEESARPTREMHAVLTHGPAIT